jgi:hypothetical protein
MWSLRSIPGDRPHSTGTVTCQVRCDSFISYVNVTSIPSTRRKPVRRVQPAKPNHLVLTPAKKHGAGLTAPLLGDVTSVHITDIKHQGHCHYTQLPHRIATVPGLSIHNVRHNKAPYTCELFVNSSTNLLESD